MSARARAPLGSRAPAARLLLGLLAVVGCGERSAPREAPPHIVLVICDALRADRLQTWGAPPPAAPALDAWAADALVFERATAPSNWTRPSMLALFTGRHPDPDRLLRPDERLPDDVPLLAERLAAAGYETIGISANPFQSRDHGADRGFSTWLDLGHKGGQRAGHWKHEIAAPFVLDRVEYVLRSRAPDARPVFLYVHLMDPHLPYDPPPDHRGRCDPNYAGPFDGRGEAFRALAGEHVAQRLQPGDLQQILALYDGEIAALDEGLARLRALVDELLGDRRVVTVVTADHGEAFGEGEGGYFMHGNGLHPGLLHVPLIVHGAGPRGRVATRVGLVDLAPTLLALAGAPPSVGEQAEARADGLPLLDAHGLRATAVGAGAPARPFVAYRALPPRDDAPDAPGHGELAILSGPLRAERRGTGWVLLDDATGRPADDDRAHALATLRAAAEAWLAARGEASRDVDTITLSAEAEAALQALGYVER